MKVMELDNLTYADLFQKLSLLLHSGIPISSGLLILSEEEQDPTVQKLLVLMAQQTEDGSTFYDALSCAGCFPAYAVGLLEVADASIVEYANKVLDHLKAEWILGVGCRLV